MEKGIFISVEGAIGVGKTTLSNLLSEYLKSKHLREIVEENPFLSKFYENKEEYALQTEAFFLFNRLKQLDDAENDILKGETVVSDYHIIKNLIFAGLTLDKKQFHRYKQVFDIFVGDILEADIIVYLHSDTDTLMKRIAMRDRSFERQMSYDYIDKLSNEYKYYFNPLSVRHIFLNKEPIIIYIDNSNLDFLNNIEDRKFIFEKVDEAILELKRRKECSN